MTKIIFKIDFPPFSPRSGALSLSHTIQIIYYTSNKSIIKTELSEEIRKIPQLKEVVERFGLQSLIVKIRTEQKKKKSFSVFFTVMSFLPSCIL